MATITKRLGGGYQARIRIKGHEASASFPKRGDAVRWASATETAIREQRYFGGTGESHTLAELIDKYIQDVIPGKGKWARVTQAVQLAWWKAELGSKTLPAIFSPLLCSLRPVTSFSVTLRASVRKATRRWFVTWQR